MKNPFKKILEQKKIEKKDEFFFSFENFDKERLEK